MQNASGISGCKGSKGFGKTDLWLRRSSVLSDIAALRYGYRYEYKKLEQKNSCRFNNNIPVRVYARSADDAVLQSVPWTSKDVEYRSNDGHYIIGATTLDALSDSAAFHDASTFIATV